MMAVNGLFTVLVIAAGVGLLGCAVLIADAFNRSVNMKAEELRTKRSGKFDRVGRKNRFKALSATMRSDSISGLPEDHPAPLGFGLTEDEKPISETRAGVHFPFGHPPEICDDHNVAIKHLEEHAFEIDKQISDILTIVELLTDRVLGLETAEKMTLHTEPTEYPEER